MPALRRGRLRLAVLACAGAVVLTQEASAAPSGLPEVQRQGRDLVAAGERFRVGFNYGLGRRYPILRYFDRSTERRLNSVVADIRRARALAALAALLDEAERLHIYLDLTGNLVWRAPPAWYDALPEQARWAVQARFWRSVARVAKRSPAVLVYELTSEPVIADADDWYCGDMDGYAFVQRIVREVAGRDGSALARRWIRLLKGAIRTHDRRHLIGLGMLPFEGPFGAGNVADLLDVLLVHEYPENGRAAEAVGLVREFAAQGKPVIVGETAPLLGSPKTWRSFLTGARRFVDGYLFFYDGRTPAETTTIAADAWYAAALRQFLGLQSSLLR